MAERKTDRKNAASGRRTRVVKSENTKKSGNAGTHIVAFLAGGIVALLVVLFLVVSTVTMYAGDRTLAKDSVRVMGIDVGGKTQEEIETMLTEADLLADFEVKFVCGNVEETVTAESGSQETRERAPAHTELLRVQF